MAVLALKNRFGTGPYNFVMALKNEKSSQIGAIRNSF